MGAVLNRRTLKKPRGHCEASQPVGRTAAPEPCWSKSSPGLSSLGISRNTGSQAPPWNHLGWNRIFTLQPRDSRGCVSDVGFCCVQSLRGSSFCSKHPPLESERGAKGIRTWCLHRVLGPESSVPLFSLLPKLCDLGL